MNVWVVCYGAVDGGSTYVTCDSYQKAYWYARWIACHSTVNGKAWKTWPKFRLVRSSDRNEWVRKEYRLNPNEALEAVHIKEMRVY